MLLLRCEFLLSSTTPLLIVLILHVHQCPCSFQCTQMLRNCCEVTAGLHVVPTPCCVEMAPEIIFFTTGFFLFKMYFAMISTCPINIGSLLSAHLLRSTRRSLLGDAMHVNNLQVACLWHTSPTVSHGFCLSSISDISSSMSNHPIWDLFRTLQACTLSPRSRL